MALGAWYARVEAQAVAPIMERPIAFLGALCALVPALLMWGFTVDDALIPLRYAHHLATGTGYRFNAHGASTDGVTPLPWAPIVAVLARPDDLVVALDRVKIVGVLAWMAGGATLGLALAQRGLAGGGDRRRGTLCAVIGLLCVGLSFPIGAWAASGMETGVATTLATIAAASFARPRRAALFAGLAASLRPELVVWSAVITGGSALARESAWDATKAARRVALSLAMSCVPFSICALVRLVAFGRAAPLAILAKPSDVAHGLVYAGAASLVTLTPVLAFAPLALRRASMMEKTIAAAAAAHVLVVIAVGGDWMPYARLMVPIAPSLALVFVGTARTSHPVSITTRTLAVVALGVWLAMTAAPAGRHVHGDRKDLIARARPLLSGARIVAALDVGWVGAATNAEIVDLAGLTDPSFATLSGGHTSKAVDVSMLLDRDIDAIVVFTPPRIVETRITRAALFARHFERAADVALGDKGAFYTIYRRRSASPVDDASP